MRLILASASPRRAELLAAAGFDFEILSVDVDERVRTGEQPDVYVRRLAAEKSLVAQEKSLVASGFSRTSGIRLKPDPTAGPAIRLKPDPTAGPSSRSGRLGPSGLSGRSGPLAPSGSSEDACILGADTSVVIDGEILGKPGDMDARSMLRRLSGRCHDVLTGVSVRRGSLEVGCVERTAVFFAPLGNDEIDWYVQSGEGRDKAGGYAIQGLASRFVRRIEGSYSNVVGLPVAAVHELLRQIAEPSI